MLFNTGINILLEKYRLLNFMLANENPGWAVAESLISVFINTEHTASREAQSWSQRLARIQAAYINLHQHICFCSWAAIRFLQKHTPALGLVSFLLFVQTSDPEGWAGELSATAGKLLWLPPHLVYEPDKRCLTAGASGSPPEPGGLCGVWRAIREMHSSLSTCAVLWFAWRRAASDIVFFFCCYLESDPRPAIAHVLKTEKWAVPYEKLSEDIESICFTY